jgi:hypothetical protein
MAGIPVAVNEIPEMVKLYLKCSPCLDLSMRYLPRDGGLMEQDYITMLYFDVVEQRIKEIMARKKKEIK